MPPRYKCNHCCRAFAIPIELERHTRGHTGEQPFLCHFPGCLRRFSQSSNEKQHYRREHSKVKPHKCEGCAMRFPTTSELKLHTRTHTKEKPYPCKWPRCNKEFSQSSALTAHTRTHTGAKPFPCEWHGCEKSFSQSGGLSKHTRMHNRKEKETQESLSLKDEGDEDEENKFIKDEPGEDEFFVDAITNHRIDNAGKIQYKIKWEGYEKESDDTWEPEANLETVPEILNEYLTRVGGRKNLLKR